MANPPKPPLTKPLRQVQPRAWLLLGTIAAVGVAPALDRAANLPLGAAVSPFAFAAHAAEGGAGGEGGEGGEGRVEAESADVEFLVSLGLFEATHRIVGALYAQGEPALAQAHLEASHHAFYEDVEDGLAAHGAQGFEDLARAFAEAVTSGAPAEDVAERGAAVLDAIAAAHAAAALGAADEGEAIHLLVATAAGDYEAGVDDGRVEEPQEYRDAWGFAKTAQARAEALAVSPDARAAQVGEEILLRLEPVWPLFPALDADTAGGDASVLYAAASWAEIAALKAK